jgi:hypothetical protein
MLAGTPEGGRRVPAHLPFCPESSKLSGSASTGSTGSMGQFSIPREIGASIVGYMLKSHVNNLRDFTICSACKCRLPTRSLQGLEGTL